MKLPDFLHHIGLNDLRIQMGALELGDFSCGVAKGALTDEDLLRLSGIGIDVSGDQIQFADDGTLTFKGLRVLVYIRDVDEYQLSYYGSLPKFHIAWCRTLVRMEEANRFAKYVVATRNDGRFHVNVIGKGNVRTELRDLKVCQNCLERLTFAGFVGNMTSTEREQRVRDFSLTEFFTLYPRDVLVNLPRETSDTQALNDYPKDWGFISQAAKARAKGRCERCGVVPDDAQFLHIHHKNGVKNDCAPGNLECLCVGCHAYEHPHMQNIPTVQEFYAKYPSRRTPRR